MLTNHEVLDMPAMSPNSKKRPKNFDLPPRQLCEDLQTIQDMVKRAGIPLGIQAEIVSAAEWSMDQHRANKMREALSLNDEEHTDLLEQFRRRNQAVWAHHSKTD